MAPEDALAYNNRALVYKALMEYELALADHKQAIMLAPEDARMYANRGLTHAAFEEYEKALVDYGRAIELEPEEAGIYYNRGFTYEMVKEYDKALADYERAIELDPQFTAMANYSIAVVYALQEQPMISCTYLGKILDLVPSLRDDLRTDPDFDPIRDEPCFQALMNGD
ncbi:MAG: tetratricopeptide repeat protein [Anaerolineae bacterium]|nr:tetratricopeptide repeat protein [Anaerolineae bacterium]